MMKIRNPKKLLPYTLVFLAFVCLLILVPSAAHTVYADGEPVQISIDKTYLKAGDTLRVDGAEGYTLRYFVDGEEIVCDELLLSDSFTEKWIVVKAYDNDVFVAEDKAYYSKIPVIYINTENSEPVTSKETYINAGMTIQNNKKSSSVYNGAITIKGRGNTSWEWPKKPYKIKLDKKTDLFGMGKNKHWVLIANYLDESLIRNKIAYGLAEHAGLAFMDFIWADVIMNGEYIGNYQLCEHIRIGDTRVNIFDWENEADEVASAVVKKEKKNGNVLDKGALEDLLEDDLSWVTSGTFEFNGVTYTVSDYYNASSNISGGYLFELSDEYDETSKFMTNGGLKVMLKSPEFLNTKQDMKNDVQTKWQDSENAYMSEDGRAIINGVKHHFSEMVDLDSLVSYWLVLEIMGNDDSLYKSRYAYIDVDGKITFGPAWDFDWGCGSSAVGFYPTGWKVSNIDNDQAFFKELLDDPEFIVKATEKYWELRPYMESVVADGGLLLQYFNYLFESGIADQARWDRHDTWPEDARGYIRDAGLFREYLVQRLAWLDEQFATDASLNESTRTVTSAHPYIKNPDEIGIIVKNGTPDTTSEHAPADTVIGIGEDAEFSVYVADGNTTKLRVYVNGQKAYEVAVSGQRSTFNVESYLLTEPYGKKNVVKLVGKNAAGATTFTNFETIIQEKKVFLEKIGGYQVRITGLDDTHGYTIRYATGEYETAGAVKYGTNAGFIQVSNVSEAIVTLPTHGLHTITASSGYTQKFIETIEIDGEDMKKYVAASSSDLKIRVENLLGATQIRLLQDGQLVMKFAGFISDGLKTIAEFNAPAPGDYTIRVIFEDGTYIEDDISITVPAAQIDTNGRVFTLSGYGRGKVSFVRLAKGELSTTAEMKAAPDLRNLGAKYFKGDTAAFAALDAQNGETTTYTVQVGYVSGYTEFITFDITPTLPVITVGDGSITLTNVQSDGYYLDWVRCAPGELSTLYAIRHAGGSQVKKTEHIVSDTITFTGLSAGPYTLYYLYDGWNLSEGMVTVTVS